MERHRKDNFGVHPSSEIDTDDISPRWHLCEFESAARIAWRTQRLNVSGFANGFSRHDFD
jgi:hypothetical protein